MSTQAPQPLATGQSPTGQAVPAPTPQSSPQQTSQQPATPSSICLTVLLIEDDNLLIKMYKTKFETEGFKILTATDGEAGLKMALEQKIDFIILDMMLPKMSGLEVLTKIRQDPKGQNIPVVILSNLAQQEQAQQALKLGAKEFLLKANLTPSQVVAKIRQYLGK